ncbi:beta-ketoacyl-[acyl-carrier-protein] synthase family protein [Streptomyces sp. NPDC007088]|uniref:beta-ketoacyl-[acyl-carrier-protein] synthase family protein n=1 Tax=Streptomyces sp. NPDC007088 TaxID=3364773 RepID=UPI00369BCBE0
MNRRAVAVTGLGAVSPAGLGTGALWDALCAGRSLARRLPELGSAPVGFGCALPEDIDVDAEVGGRAAWRMGRFSKLALLAAREAVQDAGLDPATWEGTRVAVVLGVGVGGVSALVDNVRRLDSRGPEAVAPSLVPLMMPNAAAGEIAIALGARGPSLAPTTACASGASALAVGRDLLDTGQCDLVIAGGAESLLTPLVLAAFARMGALSTRTDPATASRPFAEDRDGFVLGEGAGVVILERLAHARARRARVRALLAGTGSSTDAYHPTAPPADGAGAREAVRAALRDAGWSAQDVDHINAHGTSTPLNDAMEAAVITRTYARPPVVTAVKGTIGHTFGAAGALEAVVSVLTLEHQVVPPVANLDLSGMGFDLDCVTKTPRPVRLATALSHSFGFGGHNVVLALCCP